MIKANFAAIKILSKIACLLTYKKEKIWVLEFLKVCVVKGVDAILRINLIAFVLCISWRDLSSNMITELPHYLFKDMKYLQKL